MKNKKNNTELKSAAKTLDVLVKLNIESMQATSKEPIGPTLGQYGVSINEFCTLFNNITNIYLEKVILRAHVSIYTDKTFELNIKMPTMYYFLKQSINIMELVIQNNVVIKNNLLLFDRNLDTEIQIENLKSINILTNKRKPGYIDIKSNFLPVITKNIIFTIINYIFGYLQNNNNNTEIKSMYKKTIGIVNSSGFFFVH